MNGRFFTLSGTGLSPVCFWAAPAEHFPDSSSGLEPLSRRSAGLRHGAFGLATPTRRRDAGAPGTLIGGTPVLLATPPAQPVTWPFRSRPLIDIPTGKNP